MKRCIDIAEAMFGKTENDKGFATRLFFETQSSSSPEDAVMEEVVPNILASLNQLVSTLP